ncbi:TCAM1 protein, partial [Polyodon spathula]|nr:TCAM1 protein [Polyodon spathula]
MDKLVYAMVLMNLRCRQEARAELQKLGHNQTAVYLAGMTAKDGQHTASRSKLLSSQADFLLDVARIFKVLVAERLCDESLRDNVYLIMMEAWKNAGGKSKVSLEHLKVESRTECGSHLEIRDTEENGGSVLKSSTGFFSWVSDMLRRSPAINIHNSKSQSRTEVKSSPSSLRSLTESSVSLASYLEISQSPTTSVEESHPETKPSEPPRNPTPASTTEQEGEMENKFFSFVILHAWEDTNHAFRVQETLEQLGSGEGATFSVDFKIPGKSPLTCIQDAVNNSAFTLILLTTNFNSHWAQYKTNSVLMDSIERHHKYNTIIPFLPRSHGLPRESIPYALKCLIAMEENKSFFPKKVKKTFNQKLIENQKALWSQEQKIKQQKEKEEQLKDQNKNDELLQSAICNVQQQQCMALQYMQMLPGDPNLQAQYPPR